MHLKLCFLNALIGFLLISIDTSLAQSGFELTILHVNDFHARFEETNVYSGRCTEGDKEKNRCYGGFARLHTAVTDLRSSIPNVLFLSGGDYYQGTIWYSLLKWKPMAQFLNIIRHDAMAFGNHEFDDGIDGIVPLLERVSFPILGSNIDDRKEPTIQGKYSKSVVLERGGRRIGIIGYVTTETLVISDPGKLDITDEVKAVREESRRLKSQGVDIIIALGHAGFKKDIMIAQEIEEVDVVVGGHTNTFLYSGEDPSTEMSVDEYPFIATHRSGKKVPVVQAYAFGKYLGKLDLVFDDMGEVVSWAGNPILLDNKIEQDPGVLEALKPWRVQVEEISKEEIGKTYVFLDGNRLSCRMQECNLGNLNADAIVHENIKYPDDMYWSQTALAVINGGGIRSSIDERASNGTITMDDVLTIAPFRSTIDIVELKGIHVKEMFEHSVRNYDPKGLDPVGAFLQVSGFVVVYDINKPPGSRVVRLQARCAKCRVPSLKDVVDSEIYKIAMPSFLAGGGDGYSVIKDNIINHHLSGLLDTTAYANYIRSESPIHQGLENRILFIDSEELCHAPDASSLLGTSLEGSLPDSDGPVHNRNDIDPHEMMSEVMDRHDEYFMKHFVDQNQEHSKSTSQEQGETPVPVGYVIESPSLDQGQEFVLAAPQVQTQNPAGYVIQSPALDQGQEFVLSASQAQVQPQPQSPVGYIIQSPPLNQGQEQGLSASLAQVQPQSQSSGGYVIQSPPLNQGQEQVLSTPQAQEQSSAGYVLQSPALSNTLNYFFNFGYPTL